MLAVGLKPPAQAAVSQHGQGSSVGHPPWTGHKYWALYPLSASYAHSGARAHRAARAQGGAISVVDNSMLAPMFAQPLSLGADICMTSATKFIGGHSDLTAGILSVKEEDLAKRVAFVQVGGLVSCAWQLQATRSTVLSLSERGWGSDPASHGTRAALQVSQACMAASQHACFLAHTVRQSRVPSRPCTDPFGAGCDSGAWRDVVAAGI